MFIGQAASVSRFNYLHLGQGLFPEVGRSENAVKRRAVDGTEAENTFGRVYIYIYICIYKEKEPRWVQHLARIACWPPLPYIIRHLLISFRSKSAQQSSIPFLLQFKLQGGLE
jgi:hypothetical protein